MNKSSYCFIEAHFNCSTVVEILRFRSATQPNQAAFSLLLDGETEQTRLTYQELDQLARRVAAHLQELGLTGKQALLLYPAGLDFIVGYLGCLYAGVVAVTAYPPKNERNTPRIKAISKDAQAAIALTTTEILPTVRSLMTQSAGLETLRWLTTDNLAVGLEDSWQEASIDSDTIAFLQYTSGSTGIPKGVMISHGNLIHNAATTYQFMEHSSESKFITWLPSYHDMGLIGGILQPLYGGFPCIMMPPTAFLQRPYRWLQAISRYKGTTSGGPNFAYDLCVQKITSEQKATLDLSSWSVAFNGAEPIRYDTLERFAETFAECGFRKEAFYPCYGMAESTLMITGVQKASPPTIKIFDKAALEANQVVTAYVKNNNLSHLVGCGQSIPQQKIVIANPETLSTCQPNEVGEIWASGLSVGKGYWNRSQETEEIFHAYLSDTGEGPFLRTGDLGFLNEGEIFITGRLKDVIIIRGRNLYPQDIELTVERSHPSLRPGAGAAFVVELNNTEQLVVVQELEFRAKPNVDEVAAAIRQAVTEQHEIKVHAVVLIKPGSIPKTSSGKIQRRATKAKFQKGELEIVHSSILEAIDFVGTEIKNALKRENLLGLTPCECQLILESYLIKQVARVLSILPDKIAQEQPLSILGLDSLKVFELKNQIENALKVTVSVADFFEGLTITQLVTKILAQLTTAAYIPSINSTQIQKGTFHPLSFAQQRLWFIHQLAPDTPVYNIPLVINLTGRLNTKVLTQSLNEIIRRHEVLRTNFVVVEGQPVQVINSATAINLPIVDLREFSDTKRAEEVQSHTTELAQQPFNLSDQVLLRGLLLCLADKEYKLLLTLHHIVADAWSVGILIRELAALYEAFSSEKASPLPELPVQYITYTYWQQQYLQGDTIQSLLAYWKQQLDGQLPILNLPTDRPRSPVQTFKGAQARLVIPQTLTAALKNLSDQEGVTLYMTLLAAFKTLLYRYTGQTDILVGSPVANRSRTEIEPLIGFFVNVLVLRTNLKSELSFRELLARVKLTTLEAFVHQDLPFGKLVEELQPERNLSYNPLFQVMFVFQNVPIPTPKLSEISINCEEGYSGTSKFDLTLFMHKQEQELVATLEYNTDLFDTDTMNRMLGHFATLLEGIVANPDQHINYMPLLTAYEHHQLTAEWNNTKKNYPLWVCIHQLFEQQVERTPDSVALIFENQTLTYRELNNQANQLAHYLQSQGVKPDVIVGICMERSLEMVVALLAILKAGGAYLPLDPAYPKERLGFMLADAQVLLLLTQQHLVKELPQHQTQIVFLDTSLDSNCQARYANYSQENPVNDVKLDNLAYVIYTSGSTGQPKGVMNSHQGLSNRLLWMQDTYKLNACDRVLQKTPFSFDVSVWEFFWPLFTGARLILAKPGGHQDSSYLVELIAKEKITTLHFVPSMLQVFLEEAGLEKCCSLKNVFCSGEALFADLQERFFARLDTGLHNLYGPTEAAIDVTFWNCQRNCHQGIVPIGRPIANIQTYILDRHLQLVPTGVAGELHISGVGLARGYLNRPELTEEKFISNCFSNEANARLYKTGDLARYLPDGNIEYLGRIDHQVKLRGFRIELGEIEAVLVKHPAVREAVVLAREDKPGDKQLVAYIVAHQDQAPTTSKLRNYLKQLLPEYMAPAVFMLLDAMPLLPNGKIDRGNLPLPEGLRPTLTTTYQAPQSQIEQEIANVWQEVLHLDKVGIHDNFFDLGGNSLLIAQVNNKLRINLNKDLSIVELFQNPTINSLTQHLGSKPEKISGFKEIRDRTQRQREAFSKQKKIMNYPKKSV